MPHREFKDTLYVQFARIGRALGSPKRLELPDLLAQGEKTVQQPAEYEAGHIPGALSIPVQELKRRLGELPRGKEVIAYCRGPYCVYSLEAVTLLRRRGYRARRAEEGLPDWRARRL